jgi:hypothetical protein
MSWPDVELFTSTSGVLAVTCTASVSPATCIVMLNDAVWPERTRMSERI